MEEQDGTLDTLIGSCTVVRDFLDVTYHSYLDYLDEFRVGEPKGGKPIEIEYGTLPHVSVSCCKVPMFEVKCCVANHKVQDL